MHAQTSSIAVLYQVNRGRSNMIVESRLLLNTFICVQLFCGG